MSTCISISGEYGDHELTDRDDPFICQRCFAFAEVEAMAEIVRLRALVDEPLAEWGHRYADGSVIADSSEVVAKSRAVMSRANGRALVLVRRAVTQWEEVDV